ncbi:MAG: HEPN domain-containing protein [Desulfobacteraceae bacterium]|nr:HEPN domain-containing protein [Desulfobacteraceae bacterium]MBC2718989.1 HEPN domain-containing protein [Desulfobacteraceae bacterium]
MKRTKHHHFHITLLYLSEKAGLELNDENLELLEEVSDFNLEPRYPDDKFSFYKKSTMEFTKNKLRNVDEITSPTMHHSFRPPLSDLKSQKY